jgi:hypothetical protein
MATRSNNVRAISSRVPALGLQVEWLAAFVA